MIVDLEHTFVGCNRCVNALDWGQTGLIAFTAHNAIVIADVKTQVILARLLGHNARVSVVRWLDTEGSADGDLIVWEVAFLDGKLDWRLQAHLQGHEDVITAVCCHRLQDGGALIASTSADDTIRIWTSPDQEDRGEACHQSAPETRQTNLWMCPQTIHLPLKIQHGISCTAIPSSKGWLLLGVAGVDHTVRLYLASPAQPFQPVCRLTGHSDWIRSLAFTTSTSESGLLAYQRKLIVGDYILLASASQDKYIRIWSIKEESTAIPNGHSGKEEIDFFRYTPRPGFQAGERRYTCTVEAMLVGHEDWVHTVAWQPLSSSNSRATLLSASMDRTMALWRQDKASGLWMSEESVGDAGPSNLGYFGGCWSPQGDHIVAHGYTGALHLWRRDGSVSDLTACWTPQHSFGGHFAPVVDLSWSQDGKCLFTASVDQTARILTRSESGLWFEIARPQVHGHDFSCIATIQSRDQGKVLYASGSEEKVVRILEAPQAYIETLAYLRGESATLPSQGTDRAFGASLPALGLSNKAVYSSDTIVNEEGPDVAPRATPGAVKELPLEEFLQQSSLWPEVFKAYGHGNNLFSMASDPRGEFLASACRAQSKEFAAIWIWQVGSWKPVQQLEAHTLTVIQMCFSPDGSHLISVSRDRSLAVWSRTTDSQTPFKLLGRIAKAHARVLWTVSCSPCGQFFATGGRDNLLKIWSIGSNDEGLPEKPLYTLAPYSSSVHSLAFVPLPKESASMYIAVGLEDGNILIEELELEDGKQVSRTEKVWQASKTNMHSGIVSRLSWQPIREQGDKQDLRLASGSEDHVVHIYSVQL